MSRAELGRLRRLTDLAQLRALGAEQRLAPHLQRASAIKAEIAALSDRRGALAAALSGTMPAGDGAGTPDACLSAHLHAQSELLRQRQAALYLDLARAEAETGPLRAAASRARGRVAALERLGKPR
jgi:hypothetical protein